MYYINTYVEFLIGYAAECRDKKQEEMDQDEKDITELLMQIANFKSEKQQETENKFLQEEINYLMRILG